MKFSKSLALAENIIQGSSIGKKFAQQKQSNEALEEKNFTVKRIEIALTNVSDNVYNIAGAMNAQLTSMKETKDSLEEQAKERKRAKKESLLEAGNQSGMAKGLKGSKNKLSAIKPEKLESPNTSFIGDIITNLTTVFGAVAGAVEVLDVFAGKNSKPRPGPPGRKPPKPPSRVGSIAGRTAATVGGRVVAAAAGVGTVVMVGEAVYQIYETAKDEKIKHKYYNELTGEYETAEEIQATTKAPTKKPEETSEERSKRLGISASSAGGGRGSVVPEYAKKKEEPKKVAAETPQATKQEAPPITQATTKAGGGRGSVVPEYAKKQEEPEKVVVKTPQATKQEAPPITTGQPFKTEPATYRGEAMVTDQAPEPVKSPPPLQSVTTLESGSVDLSNLSPELVKRTSLMAKDYKDKTGKKLMITSAFRSNEKQKQLWDAELAKTGGDPVKARKKVAEPMAPLGNGKGSLHGLGLAIDISAQGPFGINILAGSREKSTGWLESFGLIRPVKNEDWHIQLAKTPAAGDNPYKPGEPIAVPNKEGKPVVPNSGKKVQTQVASSGKTIVDQSTNVANSKKKASSGNVDLLVINHSETAVERSSPSSGSYNVARGVG